MKELRCITMPDGQTQEMLPDAMQRHRHAFGAAAMACLVVLPDGTALACKDRGGDGLDAEHLDHRQTISKLVEIFGLSAFKGS
ncbi:hypothetical protein GOD37_14795 [Sinorhizobium medicae]|nr:hypothetical protein [Sinorhizobium medicae]